MVLVVRQQRLGYAVADAGVFLVELGGDALDAELLLPGSRNLQQVCAWRNA